MATVILAAMAGAGTAVGCAGAVVGCTGAVVGCTGTAVGVAAGAQAARTAIIMKIEMTNLICFIFVLLFSSNGLLEFDSRMTDGEFVCYFLISLSFLLVYFKYLFASDPRITDNGFAARITC
jgi:hypothetical protein